MQGSRSSSGCPRLAQMYHDADCTAHTSASQDQVNRTRIVPENGRGKGRTECRTDHRVVISPNLVGLGNGLQRAYKTESLVLSVTHVVAQSCGLIVYARHVHRPQPSVASQRWSCLSGAGRGTQCQHTANACAGYATYPRGAEDRVERECSPAASCEHQCDIQRRCSQRCGLPADQSCVSNAVVKVAIESELCGHGAIWQEARARARPDSAAPRLCR